MRLAFDDMGRRWEGIILPADQWAQLEQVNSLLTIARDFNGELAGFIFDLDPENLDYQPALTSISNYFGEIARATVAQPGASSATTNVIRLSKQVIDIADETALFPIFAGVNAKARDVVISEDRARGVIKVSMRLPWWSAFVRPWVTVRRRGRPEVIALGPLRRSGGLYSAELRYGLPSPSISLVAEVIRGVTRPWLSSLVAAVITAIFIVASLANFSNRKPGEITIAPNPASATISTVTTEVSTAFTTSSPSTITATTLSVVANVDDSTKTTQSTNRKTTTSTSAENLKTSSTMLAPGGISFETFDEYISARDTRAAVLVDRKRVGRSESLTVTVKISGLFINNFEDATATNAQELTNLCRARIGIPTTFVPVSAGWAPMVSVYLRGTNVVAGNFTALTVVGNIARECGTSLISNTPLRINVVRTTYYRDIVLQLQIPKDLAPGTYDLDLLPIDNSWQKLTPIEITVTE
jgi:hypothetical protein